MENEGDGCRGHFDLVLCFREVIEDLSVMRGVKESQQVKLED